MTVEKLAPSASIDWDATPSPMSLATSPAISASAMGAVEARLLGGCFCGSGVARLTVRRTIRGADIVALQCLRCGSAIGGPLKRDDHPGWESYPTWDEPLRRDYHARRQAQAIAALDATRADLDALRALARQNREEYSAWLLSSPDWRGLRGKVLVRSGGLCEACLRAPAVHVHHDTYALGRLPPAWHLYAVCAHCHGRLHSSADEWTGAEPGR